MCGMGNRSVIYRRHRDMNSPLRTLRLTVPLLVGLTLGTIACGSDASVSTGLTEPPATTIVTGENVSTPDVSEPEDEVVTSSPEDSDPSGMEVSADVDEIAEALKGLSLAEAEAWAEDNAMSVRVVEEDGEMFAVTMDFSPSRINVAMVDGLVDSVVNLG